MKGLIYFALLLNFGVMIFNKAENANPKTAEDFIKLDNADSTRLVILFNALDGNNWDQKNNWLTPGININDWYGVCGNNNEVEFLDLDGQPTSIGLLGCRINIDAQNNPRGMGLSGNWPKDFCLPSLEGLSIGGNQAVIDFYLDPDCFSNLTSLDVRKAGINRNSFEKILELGTLESLYIGSNFIGGKLPDDISEKLPNLELLFISRNRLSGSIPKMPNSLTFLDIKNNRFTFEHILPFLEQKQPSLTVQYESQEKFFPKSSFRVGAGLPFTIDLKIDSAVGSNRYVWMKDGAMFGDTLFGVNKLEFPRITFQDVGKYVVNITNPEVKVLNPNDTLVLKSDTISIEVCQPVVDTIKSSICKGELFFWKDRSFMDDTLIVFREKANNGCDSAILVDLTFYENRGFVDTLLCKGESLSIGRQAFSESGEYMVTLPNQSQNGCDSIVDIRIQVAEKPGFPEATIAIEDTLICEPEIQLKSNLPINTIGRWKGDQSQLFSTFIDSITFVSNLKPGENLITWSLSVSACPPYDTAAVSIYFEPELVFPFDTFYVVEGSLFEKNLFDNIPFVDFITDFQIEVLELPSAGTFQINEFGDFTYQGSTPNNDLLVATIYVITENCQDYETKIYFEIIPEANHLEIPPNVITPNQDQYNDTFIVPEIEEFPNVFKNVRVTIISKNTKRLILTIEKYQNDWSGRDNNGNPLPEGEYIVKVEYGFPNLEDYVGPLAIIRSEQK